MTSRRNGYYFHPIEKRHFPSASTVQKSASDSSYLLKWAAKCGAKGYLQYLLSRSGVTKDFPKYLVGSNSVSDAEMFAVSGLEDTRDGYGYFGTMIHGAFEEHLRTGSVMEARTSPDWTNIHEKAIKTLIQFWDHSGLEVGIIEKEVFNLEDKYAGRFDLTFKVSSKALEKITPYVRGKVLPTVGYKMGDLKTGILNFQEHKEQLAAYREGAKNDPEVTEEFTGGAVFYLYRDDPTKLKLYFASTEDLNQAYEVFKHKLAIWKYHAPLWWHKEHNNETPMGTD